MVPREEEDEVERGNDRLIFVGTCFVLCQCHSEDIQNSDGLQHRKALSRIRDQMRGSPNVALVHISRYMGYHPSDSNRNYTAVHS